MDILLTLLVMVLCLIAEAFFSGSEIGVVSADRMLLRHKAANGSKGARLALKMLEKPEWLLSTTLVGTNIAVVTNTTMATALIIGLFGENYSWVAVVTVAPLIWVFGEIVPKSILQQNANVLTPWVIFPLRFASYLFLPILVIFSALTKLLATLVGGRERKNPFTLREEIATMIEMSPVGSDILPSEQSMIRRVFDFTETTVKDVMVPLIDVAAIDKGSPCAAARRTAVDRAHKRQPVYDQRIDRIVGYINALDLLGEASDAPIEPFIRPVIYVPGSKSISNLLVEFRQSRSNLAVVVDEFGGAEGIVTLEDIIEEVVGELEDEFDSGEAPQDMLRKVGERHYLASGRLDIRVLRDKLHLPIQEGSYETLAGFLLHQATAIPAAGDTIRYRQATFTVEKATNQAIREVRIQW